MIFWEIQRNSESNHVFLRNSEKFWEIFIILLNFAEFGRVWPVAGRVWPVAGRVWPGAGRVWPGAGPVWPGDGPVVPAVVVMVVPAVVYQQWCTSSVDPEGGHSTQQQPRRDTTHYPRYPPTPYTTTRPLRPGCPVYYGGVRWFTRLLLVTKSL